MITEIEGIKVGHWTDSNAQTGCTVILFPQETVASGEIRGGAPATRDFALLEPTLMASRHCLRYKNNGFKVFCFRL